MGIDTQRKVTLLKDHLLTFPSLYFDVYVAGDKYEEAAFAEMFIRADCKKATDPLEADLVVFTGGPDVNPIYYDENPHSTTSWDCKRDEEDVKLYELCYANGIPMLGICRGAQFLHVMQGGKLYQDIDNHTGDHDMYAYGKGGQTGRTLKVSSVHHQCVIDSPHLGMVILGDSHGATKRWRNDKDFVEGTMGDIEAFFYPDACIIGIQGHPEYRGYNAFADWTLKVLNDYIIENPDVEMVQTPQGARYHRLTQEAIQLRDKKFELLLDSVVADGSATMTAKAN